MERGEAGMGIEGPTTITKYGDHWIAKATCVTRWSSPVEEAENWGQCTYAIVGRTPMRALTALEAEILRRDGEIKW